MRTARTLLLAAVAACAVGSVSPAAGVASGSHACSGSLSRAGAGVSIRADRLRAQGGSSCAMARSLVRSFLRAELPGDDPDFECMTAAAGADTTCLVRSHECNLLGGRQVGAVYVSRAFCMDQGYGVTFRQRFRTSWNEAAGQPWGAR